MNDRAFVHTVLGHERVKMRDLEAVLDGILQTHRVTLEEFYSKAKYLPLPTARTDASVAFRELGFSMPEIGRLIGRDHTTVLAHLRKARRPLPAAEAAAS